jgi:hypothetical protein
MKNLHKLNIKPSFCGNRYTSETIQMTKCTPLLILRKNCSMRIHWNPPPSISTPLTTLDRLGKQEPQEKHRKKRDWLKKRPIDDDKQWKTYSSPKEAMSGNSSWSTWILKNKVNLNKNNLSREFREFQFFVSFGKNFQSSYSNKYSTSNYQVTGFAVTATS